LFELGQYIGGDIEDGNSKQNPKKARVNICTVSIAFGLL